MRQSFEMNCCICKSNLIGEVFKSHYKCGKCHHIFVDYKGDGVLYHKKEYRNNSHGLRGAQEISNGKITDLFHAKRNGICDKRIKLIKNFLSQSSSVLDIGAGGGTFARKLLDYGMKVDCQEVSDICIDHLIESNFNVYKGDFCQIDTPNKYDIVTAWHVLEHVKDPYSFIKKCSSICSKFLIMEVPINRSFKKLENEWDGHYHLFSKKSLRLICNNFFEEVLITEEGVQKPCLLSVFRKK